MKAQITELAQSESELVFLGYGGSQALLLTGLYSLWRDTIAVSAAPINSTYTPISELILDDTRRALMEGAIAEYLSLNSTLAPLNSPFPLPNVVCGTAPGAANTSIAAVPTDNTDLALRLDRIHDAAKAGSLARQDDRATRRAAREGAPPSERRSRLAGMPISFPVAGGKRVIKTISHRPPLHKGPIASDLAALDGAHPTRDAASMLSARPGLEAAAQLADRIELEQRSRTQADRRVGPLSGVILPVAGLDRGIGFGYDPAAGQLRAPVVVASSWLRNETWFDPTSNITWMIPDDWGFASTPASCTEEFGATLLNATAVASFHASISLLGIGLMFDGLTIGAFFSQQRLDASAMLDAFADGYVSLDRGFSMFRLSVGGNAPFLSTPFAETVASLPNSTADPTFKQTYNQFLSTYGTHFVQEVALGGVCSLGISFNISMLASYSEAYKSHQFGLMLGFMLDGIGVNFDLGLTAADFNQAIDQQFLAASDFHLDCQGGDPSKLAGLDYLGWLLSIYFNPALIQNSIRLKPIYTIVQDPVRRALLQQVSQAYMNVTGGAPSVMPGLLL